MDGWPSNDLTDLAVACRVLARNGHEDATLGHLAARDPDSRGLWLKRSSVGLSEVRGPEDFVLLDFAGNQLSGSGGRHLEWPIHTAIMLARPDVSFTAHTHPSAARLLAATGEPIRQLCNEAVLFHRWCAALRRHVRPHHDRRARPGRG